MDRRQYQQLRGQFDLELEEHDSHRLGAIETRAASWIQARANILGKIAVLEEVDGSRVRGVPAHPASEVARVAASTAAWTFARAADAHERIGAVNAPDYGRAILLAHYFDARSRGERWLEESSASAKRVNALFRRSTGTFLHAHAAALEVVLRHDLAWLAVRPGDVPRFHVMQLNDAGAVTEVSTESCTRDVVGIASTLEGRPVNTTVFEQEGMLSPGYTGREILDSRFPTLLEWAYGTAFAKHPPHDLISVMQRQGEGAHAILWSRHATTDADGVPKGFHHLSTLVVNRGEVIEVDPKTDGAIHVARQGGRDWSAFASYELLMTHGPDRTLDIDEYARATEVLKTMNGEKFMRDSRHRFGLAGSMPVAVRRALVKPSYEVPAVADRLQDAAELGRALHRVRSASVEGGVQGLEQAAITLGVPTPQSRQFFDIRNAVRGSQGAVLFDGNDGVYAATTVDGFVAVAGVDRHGYRILESHVDAGTLDVLPIDGVDIARASRLAAQQPDVWIAPARASFPAGLTG